MHGEDHEVEELLAGIEAALVARSEDKQTAGDEKLLGLLTRLVHAHPDGFFLMHGERLAFSHRRLEFFTGPESKRTFRVSGTPAKHHQPTKCS